MAGGDGRWWEVIRSFQGGASSASCGTGAPEFRARQHTSGPKFRPVQCSGHREPVARTYDGRAAMKRSDHFPPPAGASRGGTPSIMASIRGAVKVLRRDRMQRTVEAAAQCDAPDPYSTPHPWARPDRGQVNARIFHGGADVAGWRPQRRQHWMGRFSRPDVCCLASKTGAPIPQESVIAPP